MDAVGEERRGWAMEILIDLTGKRDHPWLQSEDQANIAQHRARYWIWYGGSCSIFDAVELNVLRRSRVSYAMRESVELRIA